VVSPDERLTTRSATPAAASGRSGRPVLVTGVPRSGTTWLARRLADARLASLPGREPMNPRSGQFGLGGTLHSWTELREPSKKQVRTLERCYRGHEVRAFSRYGSHQWLSVLPWSRTIVKDPFALLAVPTIAACTSAIPVILYRHPGAVLASYRRMGWVADTTEIRRLQGLPTAPGPVDDAAAMVEFWTFLHERVLTWVDDVPDVLLVSHAEVSLGGDTAVRAIMRACDLQPRPGAHEQSEPRGPSTSAAPDAGQLHDFSRSPGEVVDGWRSRLGADEVAVVESGSQQVWESLEGRRFALS